VFCSIPRFFCVSAYANVYFKSLLREYLRAGLPSGFPSTAPPPVCVSAALGTLAVWIPHQKKKNPLKAQDVATTAGWCHACMLLGPTESKEATVRRLGYSSPERLLCCLVAYCRMSEVRGPSQVCGHAQRPATPQCGTPAPLTAILLD